MLKKTLLFLGLKIVEIPAIVFIPYLICKHFIAPFDENIASMNVVEMWFFGFGVPLVFIIGTGLVCLFVSIAIKANWDLAEKILK